MWIVDDCATCGGRFVIVGRGFRLLAGAAPFFLIQNNNVCLIHAMQCCTKLVSDVLLSISVSVLILDV